MADLFCSVKRELSRSDTVAEQLTETIVSRQLEVRDRRRPSALRGDVHYGAEDVAASMRLSVRGLKASTTEKLTRSVQL